MRGQHDRRVRRLVEAEGSQLRMFMARALTAALATFDSPTRRVSIVAASAAPSCWSYGAVSDPDPQSVSWTDDLAVDRARIGGQGTTRARA